VAHQGVELHRVHAEGAVAMQHDDGLSGQATLREAERQADAHGAEGARVQPVPRLEGRDAWRP